MSLTILRSTDQVFCRLFLCWDLSNEFLMIRLRLWVLGRKIREVKYIFITSHRGYTSTWFITIDVDLNHLAEVVFVMFFYCSYSFFPSCKLYSLKAEYRWMLHLTNAGYAPSPWGEYLYINYLEFFCRGDLSLTSIYLSNYLDQYDSWLFTLYFGL